MVLYFKRFKTLGLKVLKMRVLVPSDSLHKESTGSLIYIHILVDYKNHITVQNFYLVYIILFNR